MRYATLIILVFINSLLKAADYYVSSTGNDLNSGLGISSAWRTIDKVNSIFSSLNPGDRILFKCGDTFYGTLRIAVSGTAGSPVTIGSYGTGEKPVITGFKTVTGWKNEGNGIYSASLSSESQTNMVLIDGKQYAMGRWPDSGYRFYNSASSNISITDSDLGQTPNWTGAEVVIRKNDWSLDRCRITRHSGGTLFYSSLGTDQDALVNHGYFIQNDLRTLSQFGEWYHDHTNSRIYIYFGTTNPTGRIVEAAALNNLARMAGKNYIIVENLHFRGSSANLIEFTNSYSNNITIWNSRFTFSGQDAIDFWGNNSIISNNFVSGCNQAGIYMVGNTNSIIGNDIKNIGLYAGQALRGSGSIGIVITNNDYLIKNNIIKDIGYSGIKISSNTGIINIQNNYLDNILLILNDGGGIYMADQGISRKVDGNIITNVIGNTDGTPYPGRFIARGIYLDVNSTNAIVTNNTVAHCNEAGYMIHRAQKNRIENNTSFNNKHGMYFQNSLGSSIRDNLLHDNIFIAKLNSQTSLKFYSVSDDIPEFGTADNNFYSRPIDDHNIFHTYSPSTGSRYRTLEEWQILTGQDLNSRKSPMMLLDTADIDFYFNATSSPKVISLTQPKIDIKGIKYSGNIILQPYTSIILKPYVEPSIKIAGNMNVFGSVSTLNYRRAIPVIFTESGIIESLSINHNGGSGKFIMGVYADASGSPSGLLGVTAVTNVNSTPGWQTVPLSRPVSVSSGQTIWLSWIFQDSIGVRYTKGGPSRAQVKESWSAGMPANFGLSDLAEYKYSVFCTYRVGTGLDPGSGSTTVKTAGNTAEYSTISTLNYRRAIPVTFTESGIIESLSISHTGGSGKILMGVYSDVSGSPSGLLGVSAATNVNSSSGWQTVSLSAPVAVSSGQTVWLSWVFERTVGVRYTTGKPSRAQSSQSWPGGMPSSFGTSSLADYKYSVYCTYRTGSDPDSGSTTVKTAGNTAEYSTISTLNYRRAIPVTFTESGIIESLSISHTGGSGKILMGVYSDVSGSPSGLLGVSAATNVNSSSGWQTVSLSAPVAVSSGQTVWLSWVFERTVGVRHTTGKPSRAQSSQSWPGAMPSSFGTSSLADYKYSVYCTYRTGSDPGSGSTTVKTAGNTEEYSTISTLNYRRAIPVTFTETGVIESLSISHTGGSGRILMGVYSDASGSPSGLLGVSAATTVNSSSGWQTVSLSSPVSVSSGQTVWLSWVFERTVGVRYTTGKPSRAQSSEAWSGGLPSSFGSSSLADYKYSVYCSYSTGSGSTTVRTAGNTEEYSTISALNYRRAIPVTFTESGIIESLSISHTGGSGKILMGVYSDASGSPSGLLGVSAATTVNSSSGWQTVSLSSPVSVSSGQTVWLSWVFERTVGVRYTTGKPSRAQSSEAWSGGLPSSFGSSSLADYKYSVYCSYRTGYSQTSGDANQNPKRAVKDFAMMDDNTEKSSDTDDTGNDEMTLNLYPAEGTNKRMIVYPNPTSGNVTVSFEEASEDRHLLLIYDLQGRLVKTVNVEPWNYNIDVSIFDRKKGIYLFILKDMTNGTILNRSRVKKN